eukprot:TRINITY_DN10894_c0_g1_i1.p1 TRINITY_DN10894_c0_g1~~TRINITY_DN10894_c0_g1_i1.p1  ORF type:complete len:331 (+),score=71.95 TRINITY_DN10894_c0_g1_i1:53-1045(+)
MCDTYFALSHPSISFFFFLMIRRPPRSTLSSSSAASDVYKRQALGALVVYLPMVACGVLSCYLAFTLRYSASDGEGAPWDWFRRDSWLVKRIRSWFPVRLHVHPSLEGGPLVQAMIALHPHGATSDFRLAVDGLMLDALPESRIKRWRTLGAGILFGLPLVREVCLWSSVIDASKQSAVKAIRRGHSIVVIPGGEAEQIDTQGGVEKVKLKNRFGFVKLAMQHGMQLVPGYVFGSVDAFHVSQFGIGWRRWLQQKFRVCIPLVWGPYYMPCARKVPQDVVLGEPIELETIENPTHDQVLAAHAQYVEALLALFEEHKAKFDCADRSLTIY